MLASGVASVDSDSAPVLVVSDAERQDRLRPPRARHFRWEVSLVKHQRDVARRRLHPGLRTPRNMSSQNPRTPAPPDRRRAPAGAPRGAPATGPPRHEREPRAAGGAGAHDAVADAEPEARVARRTPRRPRRPPRRAGPAVLAGRGRGRRRRAGARRRRRRARPRRLGRTARSATRTEVDRGPPGTAPSAAERAARDPVLQLQLARRRREGRRAVHDPRPTRRSTPAPSTSWSGRTPPRSGPRSRPRSRPRGSAHADPDRVNVLVYVDRTDESTANGGSRSRP